MTSNLIERVKLAKTSISSSLREELINAGETIVRPLITILPELNSYIVTSDILEILGQIGGNDAFHALSMLLEDAPAGNLPKRLISQSCIQGLSLIGDEQSISTIIKCLGYNDNELRYAAIDKLSKLAFVKPQFKNQISMALQLALQNETYEKPGKLIESSLEKLGTPINKKLSWPNKPSRTRIIEPGEVGLTSPPVIKPATGASETPPKIIPFKQSQQNEPVDQTIATSPQQAPQNIAKLDTHPPASQQVTQELSTHKYAYLSEEEQQDILEKLLKSPDEDEKIQIINELGSSGNIQVIDELLTVLKSSSSKKIQDATIDAILKIAPNDLKLRFLILEKVLDKRVIGQYEAKGALANALRIAQIGLNRGKTSNKPIGSFLFLGPTGVGKTELAKALAEALYGNELQLVRLDMSEYTDISDKNKLIGSPPGYKGYEEGGRLTQAVLNKPQSVVLFDEIEKAHEDLFNLFLQLLDDGRLTDSKGITVSFKDTIVIMTSNAGSEYILEGLNANLPLDDIKEIVKENLKTIFKPEFLNRLNECIIFKPLTTDELLQVLELKLKPTANNLFEKYNLTLEVADTAKDYVIKATQQQEFGFSPRELNRIVESEIVKPLSVKLLDMEISESYIGKDVIPRGGKVIVGVKDSQLTLDICTPEAVVEE